MDQRGVGFSEQSSGSAFGCSYGQTCKLKNQGFPIGQMAWGMGQRAESEEHRALGDGRRAKSIE